LSKKLPLKALLDAQTWERESRGLLKPAKNRGDLERKGKNDLRKGRKDPAFFWTGSTDRIDARHASVGNETRD